ncbi:MAG: mechanosensitive ion channel [Leptospiraceae bacterium]|nr:mechanosensitive ion channel [Leptospiraceae bacterium]
MKRTSGFLLSITLLMAAGAALQAEEGIKRLEPTRTDSPRETMQSFMEAMNDYRDGKLNGSEEKINRIQDALRTLDLSEIPAVTREEKGQEAAKLLKEVLDRVIVLDYERIPAESDEEPLPKRWRLAGTEIVIVQMQEGERAGEYLFSSNTVERSREFYEKVKDLPYLEGTGHGAAYEDPWMEKYIPGWAQNNVLGLFTWQWIGLTIAILIGLIIRTIVKFSVGKLVILVSKSETKWDDKIIDSLRGPTGFAIATLFWYFSLKYFRFDGGVLTFFNVIIQILFSVNFIWLAYRLTGVATEYLTAIAAKTESTLDDQLVPLLSRTLKIFVVVFGVLVTIQNLGINVMSVLAGLGIGGLAFALAAKDAVANFFGSLMILFDKPFQAGEWIKVGEAEGTVEEIGFRSTRIRTFYNSLISIPNAELMNAKIDNMGRREFRRLLLKLGVTYDTGPDKLEGFLEGIKNIIKANPHTRKDYFHVVFHEYGPDSLIIMVYVFFKVPDWSTELVERQNLMLEIYRLAESMGVDFAFPTQTLHIETFPEKKAYRQATERPVEEIKKIAGDYGPGGSSAHPSGQGIFVPPHTE